MGIGITLNPFQLADDIFDFSGNQSRDQTRIDNSETQRRLDNEWRQKYFNEQKAQLFTERRRADDFLTRRAKDAKNAGISLLASMGGGSYSPQNIQMPQGQGGRVSGTYRSRSLFSDVATMQMRYNLDLQKAQTDNIKADTVQKLSEADKNRAMKTEMTMRPSEEVIIEGTKNPTQSAATKDIKMPDGSTMRAPADDFPDPDQYIFWWLTDKYHQMKALKGTPYQSDYSKKSLKRQGRKTRRGWRKY